MEKDALLGTTIADTYLIEKKLGEGGMGTVYVARNVRLGKRYALKVLNPEVAQAYPGAVDRFKREAVTAGQLGHVGIVQVHDIAQEDDLLYMVMDLLKGEDLETRMIETGLLAWEAIYRIISQTCDALATAHEAGIVHRDLKPANIFLSLRPGEGERAVLLDFGVAKVLDAQRALPTEENIAGGGAAPTPTLTKPGTIVGTPNYMSPEQASGIKLDSRADIYSMGAVLFHMATGEPPFDADSLLAILTQIAIDPVPLIAQINPHAARPPGLDAVIARAMAKDPANRYQKISELVQDLPRPSGAVEIDVGSSNTVNVGSPASDVTPASGVAAIGVSPPAPGITPPGTGAVTANMLPPAPSAIQTQPQIPAAMGIAASQPPRAAAAAPAAKSRSLSWTIIGVLLVVGVVGGAAAAVGTQLFGATEPDPVEPPPTNTFDTGMAEVQREIDSENWTAATGLLTSLSKQYPQRETMLHPLLKTVEREIESSGLHRRAIALTNTDPAAAKALCAQIQLESVYRNRTPCEKLLKAPATKVATPTKGDAGPDAQPAKTPQKVKGGGGGRPPRRRGGLNDTEIMTVVRANRGRAMRCFDRAFEGGYRPVGTVRVAVRISIADSGRVTSARLLDSRFPTTAAFRACLENQVRGWQFPASGGSSSTEVPFVRRYQELDLENL